MPRSDIVCTNSIVNCFNYSVTTDNPMVKMLDPGQRRTEDEMPPVFKLPLYSY